VRADVHFTLCLCPGDPQLLALQTQIYSADHQLGGRPGITRQIPSYQVIPPALDIGTGLSEWGRAICEDHSVGSGGIAEVRLVRLVGWVDYSNTNLNHFIRL